MNDYLWLIPFFPLLGFLINGLLGRNFSEKMVGIIGAGAIFLSFVTTLLTFKELLTLEPEHRIFIQKLYTWMATGNFSVDVAFRFDALSAVMTLVVTGVGFLIHVYSIGYMHGDRGFFRYFAFLNLFTFAMLLLVLGNNFLILFLGWEGVGLCSYLLIGFWYEKIDYANAGMKAFIVNRIGDFGFLLGMFLIFKHFGSLDFDQVFSNAAAVPPGVITAITLLLFVGATGKSAQIPLYVWLPDAMAGPTPVSALIHAATMVTAGVYMVSRASALYILSPLALSVVAVIGVATALFAATMAITSQDIKKVLAYSTISQLGYMFLAAGVGAFSAAIFHLMTHAFFKALLFLGAGSVMHALSNETNLMKMGGLRKHLPITFWTFLVGGLAISGIPGFSGFFSKDEILWKAFSSPFGSPVLWGVGAVAAGITAFYIFRMIYLAFYGESRVDPEVALHIHESPKVMTVPLMVLAVLSIIGGYVGIPHVYMGLEHFLEPVFEPASVAMAAGAAGHASASTEFTLMGISVVIALAGIYLAYQLYVMNPEKPRQLAQSMHGLYTLLFNKYYVDEIYQAVFVKPFVNLSNVFFWRFFDVKIIDGIVNGVARIFGNIAAGLRRMQTGIVQMYALSLMLGAIIIFGYFILR
ncbi:MAG: NADH-quinone oxidoreductase subunit L [candidate division KSB1 bacterium]|nr:NADH-quinone oxidoreductase subunit L [candidate division KSB1 bacterium]MDQ7063625.1 NADH-quinone oxidoreductase subunit L [candidate division KSB1 bacterium]